MTEGSAGNLRRGLFPLGTPFGKPGPGFPSGGGGPVETGEKPADLSVRSFRFRRFERLKEREGIRKVFSRGRAYGCPGAKLFVLKNGLSHNRIGFTLARKYGNAVERNRAKRLGREAYRFLRPRLKDGYDLVLLVYPGLRSPVKSPDKVPQAAPSPDVPNRDLRPNLTTRLDQLKTLFSKAGLYQTSIGCQTLPGGSGN